MTLAALAGGRGSAQAQTPVQTQAQASTQATVPVTVETRGQAPAPLRSDRNAPGEPGVRRGRVLGFPRDHGAHLATRTEWWYATGWLGDVQQPLQPSHGFQVTFFRSRTGLAAGNASRFAARQLLFAHAAITDLRGQRHLHDQRVVRWSEAADAQRGRAGVAGGDVLIQDWSLRDDGRGWLAQVAGGQGDGQFKLQMQLQRSQPLLLQGDAGFSRKGPDERQASHYYSEPQLVVSARIALAGAGVASPAGGLTSRSTGRGTGSRNGSTGPDTNGGAVVAPAGLQGRGWMDHEWSDEILHPDAVGWDWIGINLFDGSALTAFLLRRRDGSTLWGGGSFRAAPEQPAQSFAPDAVRWQPGRRWRSPDSAASYPVDWVIDSPAGRHRVRALMDAQELDSRASTGTIYWEGLSELLDSQGVRVGLGYLEMTGYSAGLRL